LLKKWTLLIAPFSTESHSIFAQDEKKEKGNFLYVVSIVSVSLINAAMKIVAMIAGRRRDLATKGRTTS
jgi:hypothetical protein